MAEEQATTQAEAASDDDVSKQRNHKRRSVLWPAKLDVGKHEFACQIWNLSLGGARLRFDIPLKEGSSVILRIPNRDNARITGRVAWQSEDTVGIIFQTPPSKVREIFHDRLHVLGLE